MTGRKRYRQAVRPVHPDTVRLRRFGGAAAGLVGVLLVLVVVAVAVLLPRANSAGEQSSPDPAVAALPPDPTPAPSLAELPMSAHAPAVSHVQPTNGAPDAAQTPDAIATPKARATIPPTGSSGSIAVVPPAPPSTSVEPEDLTGYRWPLRKARMTSFFAERNSGFLTVEGERIHPGLDIATFCGDRIYAAHGGIVIASGRRYLHAMAFSGSIAKAINRINRRNSWPQMAITVVVDDGNGYRSLYAHMSETAVEVGDTVRTGQLLGYEGATGDATGCHLHYEMIRMDGSWFRVAPERVREYQYPALARERVDPLRVLSLKDRWHARFIPGINPPTRSPGLGRATAHNPSDR